MRNVAFVILAVAVVCAGTAGEGLAVKFEQASFGGISGWSYQKLGDLDELITDWNRMMGVAAEQTPEIGATHAEDIGLGYSVVGDIRYRIAPRALLALRFEYLTDNSSTLASIFGAEFSAAAVPITVTAMYEFPDVWPSVLRRAKLNLGVGGGAVMRGVYKFELYFPVNEQLTARATTRGFQLHGLAELEYPVLDRWGLTAEISYRYTHMGELTYRSVSGVTEATRTIWEGDGTAQNPGTFVDIPFPEEGDKVVYTTSGDVMKLDFSGFNFFLGVKFYAW